MIRMALQIILYILSFAAVWFAAGVIVNSVDKLAHKLGLSSFSLSFFVLGMLTSIPEISVGINSLINNKPEIFTGDLVGGILVIFLLAIPLLAIFGNGVKLNHQMSKDHLVFALFVILTPSIFVIDGRVTLIEGLASIFLYAVLILIIEKKKGLLERLKDNLINNTNQVDSDLLKLIFAAFSIFIVSRYIVSSTIFFSSYFNVSTYLISLIIISLGTNLPELSLVFKSLVMKKKEVALGDYLGSAAANTVIFGVLTIVKGSDILIQNHFLQTFIFVTGGLTLFYIFSRSKQDISRKEGIVLLLVYFAFLVVEMI